MHDILRHFKSIRETAGGGYAMPDEARSFFEAYFRPHGFELSELLTYADLRDALRTCNAQDFEHAVQKPAPTPGLRFLWNRLRKLGRSG